VIVALAQIPHDRAHVAHAEIADMMETLGEGGVVLLDRRRSLYPVVRNQGADGQAVFFIEADLVQTVDLFQADEMIGGKKLVADKDHQGHAARDKARLAG